MIAARTAHRLVVTNAASSDSMRTDGPTWRVRLRVRGTPGQEVLVSTEDRLDELIEHVLGILVNERRVRVQDLVAVAVETRAMFDEMLSTRTRLDDGHDDS